MAATYQHGGNLRRIMEKSGLSRSELVDFSANINPLGFPEWLRPLISSQLSDLVHYPDPEAAELTRALAEMNSTSADQVLVANGASELLHLLPQALNARRVVLPVPSYGGYEVSANRAGIEVEPVHLSAEEGFRLSPSRLNEVLLPGDLVMLGQPNNPTGTLTDRQELLTLIQQHPEVQFVIDESFIDFVAGEHSLRQQRTANVVIVHSLTKVWAIPGLRLGYLLAEAALVKAVRQMLPEWSVNSLAQAVGVRAMADRAFLPLSRTFVSRQRDKLSAGLASIAGITPFPAQANFVLARIDLPGMNGTGLVEKLLEHGVVLRDCTNFSALGADYVRIAVRGDQEQDILFSALRQVIGVSQKVRF